MAVLRSENVLATPTLALRGLVTRYNGFSFQGLSGGVHPALPSRHVTIVIPLSGSIVVGHAAGSDGDGAYHEAFVAGLRSSPLPISQRSEGSGVIVSVSPIGSRQLLGAPARVVAGVVVRLEEYLGAAASELQERLAGAKGWAARFKVIDEIMVRSLRDQARIRGEVRCTWGRLVASGGRDRVEVLAAEACWSRRHLENQFREELGLGIKQAARVLRFERAVAALDRRPTLPLARIAVDCGYYDQPTWPTNGDAWRACR